MTYRYQGRRYIANPDGSLEKDSDGDTIGSDRWYAKRAAKKFLDAEKMRKEAEEKEREKKP